MQAKTLHILDMVNRQHALEKIILDLQDALKFYADKENYESGARDISPTSSWVLVDEGSQAREILKKYPAGLNELYDEIDSGLFWKMK